MRLKNTSEKRTPEKGQWSGIAIEPGQTLEVENEEFGRAFAKNYPWIIEVADWKAVFVNKPTEVEVEQPPLPEQKVLTKKQAKKKTKVIPVGEVVEMVRSPDYIRDTEKEMRKHVPVVKIWRIGIFKHKPFIRIKR